MSLPDSRFVPKYQTENLSWKESEWETNTPVNSGKLTSSRAGLPERIQALANFYGYFFQVGRCAPHPNCNGSNNSLKDIPGTGPLIWPPPGNGVQQWPFIAKTSQLIEVHCAYKPQSFGHVEKISRILKKKPLIGVQQGVDRPPSFALLHPM